MKPSAGRGGILLALLAQILTHGREFLRTTVGKQHAGRAVFVGATIVWELLCAPVEFEGVEKHPMLGDCPIKVTVCPVSGGGCPRDYQKEIVAYRAAVRFEALFSADVAKKQGRRYSLAPCAPDPEGDDPAGGLLLLAHDRRECIRATVDAAGIVAAGRFELARVAA